MLINADAIRAAAERIAAYLQPTPTIYSHYYTRRTAANIFLKLEMLQPTHSFKVRGALNALLTLPEEQRQRGVVTASQGNHGLGVTYAAGLLGLKAAVYLAKQTPEYRIQSLRDFGAEIVLYGDSWDEANRRAIDVAEQDGKIYIHPFNDPSVMAGQGTIFLEMLAQMPAIDLVIASIGGGGLISGVTSAAHHFSPATRVVGVETIGADSMYQSRNAGHIVELPAITSVATSLGARRTEQPQFELVTRYLSDLVVVSDDLALQAGAKLLQEEKLLVEPAASCILAALTSGQIPVKPGGNVGVIVCGANIKPEMILDQFKPRATVQ